MKAQHTDDTTEPRVLTEREPNVCSETHHRSVGHAKFVQLIVRQAYLCVTHELEPNRNGKHRHEDHVKLSSNPRIVLWRDVKDLPFDGRFDICRDEFLCIQVGRVCIGVGVHVEGEMIKKRRSSRLSIYPLVEYTGARSGE